MKRKNRQERGALGSGRKRTTTIRNGWSLVHFDVLVRLPVGRSKGKSEMQTFLYAKVIIDENLSKK